MKRGKPLVSKGFKPKVYVRPPRAMPAALRVMTPPAAASKVMTLRDTFNPQPKFPYIRSPSLQVACRTIACTWPEGCVGLALRPTAWAHSNWAVHGKGMMTKASDQYVAALCSEHHSEIDQGSKLDESERQLMWWLSHQRTVILLLRLGRWPVEVPVPNIADYPF